MGNNKIEPEQEKTNGLGFGDAIRFMEDGKRVSRTGWSGKGMFVYLVPPASYPVQTGAAKEFFGEGSLVPYNAYMAIKNVDDTVSTWTPSNNDCLAKDWYVVDSSNSCDNSTGSNSGVVSTRWKNNVTELPRMFRLFNDVGLNHLYQKTATSSGPIKTRDQQDGDWIVLYTNGTMIVYSDEFYQQLKTLIDITEII